MGDSTNDPNEQPQHIFKVVITGEAMTGKSCLMKRWSEKSFSDTYLSTVGVEFGLARMRTMNVPINVQIWDTAGQARFRSITVSYHRGASCAFVVFDRTSHSSWEAVPTHLETYRQNGTPDAPIYVVGNKCDLESKTEVDIGTVLDFCAREKVSYFDVSCKSGFNVDSLLTVAMNDVYRRNVMHYTSEPITALLSAGEFAGIDTTPKRADEFDFSSQFLEGLFADREFVHAHSDYRARINTGLLALYGVNEANIKMLESQKVDKEVLHDLLESFYGSARVGHGPIIPMPAAYSALYTSHSSSSSQESKSEESSTSSAALDPATAEAKCRHLTQMAVLYQRLGFRPGEEWAEAAIREAYVPSLNAEQLIRILVYAYHEHHHENIVEIAFEGAYKFQGEILEMASTNQDLISLAAKDTALYGLFFFKLGSSLVGFPPEKRYNLLPKCPEWLRSKLHTVLLKHAQTPAGLAIVPEERNAKVESPTKSTPTPLTGILSSRSSSSSATIERGTHSSSSTQLPTSTDSSALTGNLIIEIEGQGPSSRSVAHDWVLHQRWPWMRTLMSSGLVESRDRQVVLPTHFPPHLLSLLLSYFYGSPIQKDHYNKVLPMELSSERAAACAYAMTSGAEFGICSITSTSTAHDVRPMPGFELFITCCKLWTIKALTSENCLEQLLLFSSDETFDVQLTRAIEYAAKHASTIVKTPTALATVDLIPEAVWKKVFIASMKQP